MASTTGISAAYSVDYLFSSSTTTQDQLDSLSNNALSRGIDHYTKKDYVGAAKEFKRSIGASPNNANASTAYDYLAQAYLQQGKTTDVIKTYKEAIKAFPTADSFHLKLGDIYFRQGKAKDAQAEYEKAVKLNPNSSDNRYSLGQIYLTNGRLSDAKDQFTKVTHLFPTSATGFYGLGQVLRKMGDNKDAILQLKKAIAVDKTFTNSYLELGYAYADAGDTANAQKQLDSLNSLKSTQQAASLQNYMTQAANPKLVSAFGTNGFNTADGPGTVITDLASELSAPNAAKDFSMNFVFSKDMDKDSVQNIANWQIARQSGKLISDTYNFGLSVPSTEVNLPTQPSSVVYDAQNKTAAVTFTVSQNAAGAGTIDPSHISFTFKGKDTYGKIMDPKADEYSGFSKIV